MSLTNYFTPISQHSQAMYRGLLPKLIYFLKICIYLWLCWVSIAVGAFSTTAGSGGSYSPAAGRGHLTAEAFLVAEHGLQASVAGACGPNSSSAWISSWTRDQTCIGRQSLNHWTAEEAHKLTHLSV